MISTVIVAFSMFSAIPMPQTEWTNKSMRYALCAFPLIGAVIGVLVCLWRFVCLRMEFSEWILAAGICVLPVLVTGGIHLDGFCDTADALASHQDTEKKLQILKDPHMGRVRGDLAGLLFYCPACSCSDGSTNAGRSDGAGVWLLYQQKPFRACSCELSSCEKQWSGIYFCRVRG